MKKKAFIITCVLLYNMCFCQEIAISAVSTNPNDSSAIFNPKFDLNNEICALIVLHPHNLIGLQIKGAVVETQTVESEIHVYVPNRTKRLTVYHNDYIPMTLELNDLFGLANGVVGGNAYNIYLSGQNNAPKERSKESNYLCFEANVPIASITIDGQVCSVNGKTKISRLVRCGEYHYIASAYGYPDVEGTVVVRKAIEPISVSLVFEN